MAPSERKIWIDGTLHPWHDATVHVLSQSIQRGSLVFDVMAVYQRAQGLVILGLREHCQRFVRSMELSGMETPYSLDQLLSAIGSTVRANPGAQMVKISAYYPGIALDVLPVDPAPTVAIAAFAISDFLPGGIKITDTPARLQIADTIKMPASVLSPHIKIAASYTASVVAKRRARKEGFNDILFLDQDGNIAESSTQSFFLVEDGTLFTASLETVLAGVTRQVVLDLADDEGIPCRVAPLPGSALASADEAFLAGTSINVWPVACVGDRELPQPVPGDMTRRLKQRLARLIAGDDREFSPRWLQPI